MVVAAAVSARVRATKASSASRGLGCVASSLWKRLVRALPALLALSVAKQVVHGRRAAPGSAELDRGSQDERLALLHEKLPGAIKAAGCGGSAKLWGVTLRGGPGKPGLAEDKLLRQFLRAREWEVEPALLMIESSLRWRRKFGVDKLRAENFKDLPADEISGPDANGHTVVTLRLGAVDAATFSDRNRYLQWRLCMQEVGLRSLALWKEEGARPGYVYVLDCAGLRLCHVGGAARRCAMELAKTLMDFYPDYLKQTHIVNAPGFVAPAWRLFRPFLPSSFCSAVQVYSDGEEKPGGYG